MLHALALTLVARGVVTYLGSRTFLYFPVANALLTAVPRRFSGAGGPALALLFVSPLAVTYAAMRREGRRAQAAGMVRVRARLREAAAGAVRGARRLKTRG